MDKKDSMTAIFIAALTDVFKDEDERTLPAIGVDSDSINGNDLILAMFFAFHYIFNQYTGEQADPLEFISILTRLLFQEQKEILSGTSEEDEDEKDGSDE